MKNLLLFLSIILSFNVYSQISYEERFEIVKEDGYSKYKIYEFGEYGLLMRSVATKDVEDNTELKFELINTNLEIESKKSVMLGNKMYDNEIFITNNCYHNLFKGRKGKFTLVSIDIKNFKVYKVDGILPKKMRTGDMAVLGDYAYFKARVKRKYFVFSLNWKTGETNTIPVLIQSVKPKNIFLKKFQVLEASNEIFLYLIVIEKKNYDLYVMRLNENGEKESLFNMNKDIEKIITDITAFPIGNDQYIFSGTYTTSSIRDKQHALPTYGKFSTPSIGVFFCKTNDNNNIEFIEFYNFLDLNNFLNFLSEKRQKKIKKKRESKRKEYDLSYDITMHDIIHIDDAYILLGEAFNTTFRIKTYEDRITVNGVTETQTRSRNEFDGFQYSRAFIARFENDGNMEWDHCLNLNDASKTLTEKKNISIQEQNANSIKLVFSSSNKINYEKVDFGGKILHDFESVEIETSYDDKKVISTVSNLDYWYDNYFIVYGTQTIEEKDSKGKKREKKILYISKVLIQ